MKCFERELHEYVVAVEREGSSEELARLDVDLPFVSTVKIGACVSYRVRTRDQT
jgi:hypothetical protein